MGYDPRSISTSDWVEVKALLLDALGLEPARRTAYLNSQKVRAHIRREVESLLSFEPGGVDILDESAISLSKELFTGPDYSVAGQEVGAYRIVSELGIGGMGAVYLAERNDGKFEQRVAIKLLRREFNVHKVRAAFDREIAIQAKLVHPNIAAVLDTGTTAEGIPYIVMEYVDGVPFDRYCRDENLGLDETLKLFDKACTAVAFAHQNLIVHRDLKPSNVLVTPNGDPVLLDFGISRLLDEAENALPSATMSGSMTPEYASPEQLKGETITTATDIYSLGVILLKLLTDAYPNDLQSKATGRISRAGPNVELRAPSSLAASSSRRRVTPKMLKGDLDNILLKALSRRPEERYRTVDQFTDDIRRFLAGLPTLARRATRTERAQKFVRRHKGSAAAVTLIALSLVVGIGASIWQANIARHQAELANAAQFAAEQEANRAKAEQAKSEKISRFMAKMISYANSSWYAEGSKFGGDARVVDALLDLSDKIDTEFATEPDVAAELHHKFREALSNARPSHFDPKLADLLAERTRFHALRALELRTQFYGDWHELVAKDLFYSYSIITEDEAEQGRLLDRAINMMRATNPRNLNLPYMLESYSSRLLNRNTENFHEPFRNAVTPHTDEDRIQIAERYLCESLPLFRFYYKEDNTAIFYNECQLSYALALQEKWAEMDEHLPICRVGIQSLAGSDAGTVLENELLMVEEALATRPK